MGGYAGKIINTYKHFLYSFIYQGKTDAKGNVNKNAPFFKIL